MKILVSSWIGDLGIRVVPVARMLGTISTTQVPEVLFQVRIQRWGDRWSGPPPGKSQVVWVSIGNKQLDPPMEKVGPPPPPSAFFCQTDLRACV